ncbi:MAG TPA: hypothetical protein VNM39_01990 [Verrucomicrobiae bacterium]|nr:hypothetical protein [Verrucomicrobiae bacterium]
MDDRDRKREAGYSTAADRYWQREIERRIALIEAVKPDVLNDRVANLINEVRSLKHAFYTFAFAVLSGSLIVAFTARI